MEITSSYNAKTKTITVTDVTDYLPGERALLSFSLLADGLQVATFPGNSTNVSYTIPSDGIREFTVESVVSATSEPADDSNAILQLTTEYAYTSYVKAVIAALASNGSIRPCLQKLKLIKAIRAHFEGSNILKSKKLLTALS